jgi:pimeloyl-ACP methyl ester carboxylesterase
MPVNPSPHTPEASGRAEATFVLVHGGFGGGWVWRDFAPLLRDGGHIVYTPTLTGLGERLHLGTPETDLSTHVLDVLNLLEYEDLHGVVLAGHSYGGLVITGVADRVPERIAHLVYIDADLPRDGESEVDAVGPEEWPKWQAVFRYEGWRVYLGESMQPADPWRRERLAGQPAKTFEEKLHLRAPTESWPFTRTYIAASDSAAPLSIARVQDDPAWRLVTIEGGHRLYADAPRELADTLLALTR